MSPIKGLSDRESREPRFPDLGQLRKGAPRPEDGKGPGRELHHWRFTSDHPQVQVAFERIYGQEPTEINVFLPYPKIDDNFETWQEAWTASGLQHRCDGETTTRLRLEDGSYTDEPHPCPGGCKPVGRLHVILQGLYEAGYIGYVTVNTGSVNDIRSIMDSLLATAQARGDEDMQGIGFCLRRVQKAISVPTKDGGRVRRKKWLVELVPAKEWILQRLRDSQREANPELPAPVAMAQEGPPEQAEVVEGEVVEAEPESEPEPTSEHDQSENAKAEERKPDPDHIAGFTSWPKDKRDLFWKAAEHKGLSTAVVLSGFGVGGMAEYEGTVAQARAVLAILDYGVNEAAVGVTGLYEAFDGQSPADAVADGLDLERAKERVGALTEAKSEDTLEQATEQLPF